MKKFISFIMCILLIISAIPQSVFALPLQEKATQQKAVHTTNEKSEAEDTKAASPDEMIIWWFQIEDGAKFNEHDFKAAQAFFEEKNPLGVANGAQMSFDYDKNNPQTWAGTGWKKDQNGEMCLYRIQFYNTFVGMNGFTGMQDVVLGGTMNFSECKSLVSVVLGVHDGDDGIPASLYEAVNFSNCDKLSELNLSYNIIKALEITGCTSIEKLDLAKCGFKTVDLSGMPRLEDLDLSSCPLEDLDLSDCKNLKILYIENCGLSDMDLSNQTKLEILSCRENKLTKLDVTPFADSIKTILATKNNLSGVLDLSECKTLRSIVCGDCELRELVLPKNPPASDGNSQQSDLGVRADGNLLTKIDARNCTTLSGLFVDNNYLTELDLSDCSRFATLRCANNRLTSITLGDAQMFSFLDCSNNFLTELNIPTSAEYLYKLDCSNNYIKELDVSAFWNLRTLNCENNLIKKLELGGQDAVALAGGEEFRSLYTKGNPIEELISVPFKYDKTEYRIDLNSTGGGYAVFDGKAALAEPESGCTFQGWYSGDECVKTNATIDVTTMRKYTELTAKFTGSKPSSFTSKYQDSDYKPSVSSQSFPSDAVFNENDIAKIKAFADIKDAQGKTNGEKLMSNYASVQPKAWNFVKWEKIDEQMRITDVYLDADIDNKTHKYVEEKDRYTLSGELDLSGMDALEAVFADRSGISGINLEGCTAFKYLAATDGLISKLNIKGCTNIIYIDVANNKLSEIDISESAKLVYLDVSGNELTKLDNLGKTKLVTLLCSDNKLTNIDVSGLSELFTFGCENNKITKLDLTKSKKLAVLYCMNNEMTELSITKGTPIKVLNCSNNKLKVAYIPEKLWVGRYDNNEITSLGDTTEISEAVTFTCSNNKIKKLVFTGIRYLKMINVSHNELTTFKLSKSGTANDDTYGFGELAYIDCSYNKLTELKLPMAVNHDNINYLDCSNNNIKELDLLHAGWNMYYLNIKNNPMESLKNAPMRYITKQLVLPGSQADKRLNIKVYGNGTLEYDLDTLTVKAGNDVTYLGMYDGKGGVLTLETALSVNGMDNTDISVCFGLLGDANLDGKVDTGDAVVVLKLAADMIELSGQQAAAANMDGNDKVNTADAVHILRKVAGL